MIYSDESHTGYGGYMYIVDKPGSEVLGTWSVSESVKSPTWRELVALIRAFNSVAESLKGRSVRWCTDSKNEVQILKVSSSKPKLQDVAMTVVSGCQGRDVALSAEWVCTDQNVQAYFFRRCNDSDDWQISPLKFCIY